MQASSSTKPSVLFLMARSMTGRYLDKDKSSFTSSQLLVPGMMIKGGRFTIFADILCGRNYPFIGPDTFSDGLAAGSGNSDWHTYFNLDVGYYF